MTYTIRVLLLTSIVLALSGCASSRIQSKASTQINVTPAIDVPYGQVIENVQDYLGVNVRWGGQIIAVENTQEVARLTILAYPLDSKGLPKQQQLKGFVGGRFIVETDFFDSQSNDRFLTVFGPISGKEILNNGKLTKTIPVVTALEIKEWSANESRYGQQRHRLPYNGLGFGIRLGHASVGYDYYSHYGYVKVSPFFYPYRDFRSRGVGGRRFR